MLSAGPLGSPPGVPVTIEDHSNHTQRLTTAGTGRVSPLPGGFIAYEIGITRRPPILG